MRFYNGTPGSRKSEDAAEKLLRGYKSNINKVRRKANYGSATGGTSSISGSSGSQVIKDRQKRIGDGAGSLTSRGQAGSVHVKAVDC